MADPARSVRPTPTDPTGWADWRLTQLARTLCGPGVATLTNLRTETNASGTLRHKRFTMAGARLSADVELSTPLSDLPEAEQRTLAVRVAMVARLRPGPRTDPREAALHQPPRTDASTPDPDPV